MKKRVSKTRTRKADSSLTALAGKRFDAIELGDPFVAEWELAAVVDLMAAASRSDREAATGIRRLAGSNPAIGAALLSLASRRYGDLRSDDLPEEAPEWVRDLREPAVPVRFFRAQSGSRDRQWLTGFFARAGKLHAVTVAVFPDGPRFIDEVRFDSEAEAAALLEACESGKYPMIRRLSRVRELTFQDALAFLRPLLEPQPSALGQFMPPPSPSASDAMVAWRVADLTEHLVREGLPTEPEPKQLGEILRLRIDLRWSKPPLWRRIEIPADAGLEDLHDAIQLAFEWDDSHLHEFNTRFGRTAADPFGLVPEEDREPEDHRLGDVFEEVGDVIEYQYDFGDGWVHLVKLEASAPPEDGLVYPRCLGGRRAAPKEDCGGVGRWDWIQYAFDHPDSPAAADLRREAADYDEGYLEWLRPVPFDQDEVDRRLQALDLKPTASNQ